VAYYLFNLVQGRSLREQAAACLRVRMWGVGADERHADALAPGDVALIYLGAPEWELIGRVELASAVHEWTPSEAETYPGDAAGGVSLARVEEWKQPVPMDAVLAEMGPTEKAKAAHEWGVVRITDGEYETALRVATGRGAA
jgi:hypothetical protein